MDINSILGALSGIIPVDQIVKFLSDIATKVPELSGIISTITGFITGAGA